MTNIDLLHTYRKKRCLIIDDFPSMRTSVRRMLTQFGAQQVDTAATGEEAVNKCAVNSYDLILSDFNMGEAKTGQQILEELRHLNTLKNTALFVMITAETTRIKVIGTIEHEPDGYIAKPFTQKVLQKRLDKILIKKESLFPINQAIDDQEYEKALELCNTEIESGKKFKAWCKRTKSKILFQMERYDEGEQLLTDLLSERELDWALLELGKVYFKQERYREADEKFTYLIKKNENYLASYDWLAKSQEEQGNLKKSQEIIEEALAILPNSVLRHKKLGTLCQKNNDHQGAKKAYRQVIKHSTNSIHEKPDNYYTLARSLTLSVNANPDSRESKKDAEEAMKIIEKVNKKYPDDKEVVLQSTLMEAYVHRSQNNEELADAKIQKAHKMIKAMDDFSAEGLIPELGIERAKIELARGSVDVAANLLNYISDEHCDNPTIMDEIDTLFSSGALKVSKENTIKINKNGIAFFQDKNFNEAIITFTNALKLSPNHVGLNLNLVQTLLESVKEKEADKTREVEVLCRTHMKRVSHIPPNHRQYARFRMLSKRIDNRYKPTSESHE